MRAAILLSHPPPRGCSGSSGLCGSWDTETLIHAGHNIRIRCSLHAQSNKGGKLRFTQRGAFVLASDAYTAQHPLPSSSHPSIPGTALFNYAAICRVGGVAVGEYTRRTRLYS